MFQGLLSAFLCLCWQRVTPPDLLSPMSQLPGDTPPALGSGTLIPQGQLSPPLSVPRNSRIPILQQPHPY